MIELLLLSLVFWVAVFPVLRLLCRKGRGVALGALTGGVLLQGALVWLSVQAAPDYQPESAISRRPVEIPDAAYIGSKSCKSCHPSEYHTWHASYHRTMTRKATPENVKGVFDGRVLDNFGFSCWPVEKDGSFYARMNDPEWAGMEGPVPTVDREIALITGSHHMQVYWMVSGHGRILEQMPFVWLVDEQRWIPRNSAFLKPLEPPMTEIGRWNTACLNCHATGIRPRVRGELEADTQVSEFGIACEACHGPGEAHAAAHRNPLKRYQARLDDGDVANIVQPYKLSPARSAEVCGQCHAILTFRNPHDQQDWMQRGFRYRPGDKLEQARFLVRPEAQGTSAYFDRLLDKTPGIIEHQFWPDGQVRVSGREYNGLINTPCFTHGGADEKTMTCLSCHVMHPEEPVDLADWADDQLGPGMRSNAACTQCHAGFTGEALTRHTHHTSGSSGSSCYNCHMPHTTYGLLKAIRSHTIENPSVKVSLETGRPNACNQCHLDRSLQWTADHLRSWYGIDSPVLPKDERELAASLIWLYKGDAAQRALMAWSLGWDAALEASDARWMPPHLAELMRDPYDAVRFIARRSLLRHEGFRHFEFDHMASPGERSRAGDAVIAGWLKTQAGADAPRGDRLLINADGQLDLQRKERLLEQRDNSLTRLLE